MSGYVVSDLALDDLSDIRQYIAADNVSAADRVIAGFFHRFRLIAEQPELGAARPEFKGGNLRVHSVGSFVIFYRIVEGDVEIARVLHGSRDVDALID